MLYKALHNFQNGDKFFEAGSLYEEAEVLKLGTKLEQDFEPYSEAEAEEKNIGVTAPELRHTVNDEATKAPSEELKGEAEETDTTENDAQQEPEDDQNQNKNGGDQTQQQTDNGQA